MCWCDVKNLLTRPRRHVCIVQSLDMLAGTGECSVCWYCLYWSRWQWSVDLYSATSNRLDVLVWWEVSSEEMVVTDQCLFECVWHCLWVLCVPRGYAITGTHPHCWGFWPTRKDGCECLYEELGFWCQISSNEKGHWMLILNVVIGYHWWTTNSCHVLGYYVLGSVCESPSSSVSCALCVYLLVYWCWRGWLPGITRISSYFIGFKRSMKPCWLLAHSSAERWDQIIL